MVKQRKSGKSPREARVVFLNPSQIELFRQIVRMGLKTIWQTWSFRERREMTSALERMDGFLRATSKLPSISFASITQDL